DEQQLLRFWNSQAVINLIFLAFQISKQLCSSSACVFQIPSCNKCLLLGFFDCEAVVLVYCLVFWDRKQFLCVTACLFKLRSRCGAYLLEGGREWRFRSEERRWSCFFSILAVCSEEQFQPSL